MELAGAEHTFLGVDAFDGKEIDAVQLHRVAIPVSRRAPHGDFSVRVPGFEDKCAVADEVLGPGPGRAFALQSAVGRDDFDGHGIPRVVVHGV